MTLTIVDSSAPYALDLAEIGSEDSPRAGTKAVNLGALARAGFPVPDGFVLTTAAFEQFLTANNLGPGSSSEVVGMSPLPTEIADALYAAAEQLGDEPLAVRSSGVAEDLAGASFAGQYETVLDVRGPEALAVAVRRCWASAFGARVAAYADGTAHRPSLRSMAVLVQRLVTAEAAGVAFTANPVTGDRSVTVVNAVQGLGERLVSGQASADEWLVRGAAAECRAAPEGAIGESQAVAVAVLARQVERYFGWTPHVVPRLLTQPRRVAMMIPPTARFGVELFVREWRESVLPRYVELATDDERRVESASPHELVEIVDRLADAAGDYFTSLTAVAGFSAKSERPLAAFYRAHLHPRLGGSHLDLLAGLRSPAGDGYRHAVQSLDWFHATLGERERKVPDTRVEGAAARERADARRREAEARARAALAHEPRLVARFERLLSTAQRFGTLREEHTASFTLPWPIMRRAVLRVGEELKQRGLLTQADDVFFLTRAELLGALDEGDDRSASGPAEAAGQRRADWQRRRRLTPPLLLGELPPLMRRIVDEAEAAARGGNDVGEGEGLRGIPASAGRARGPVRVVRGLEELDRLRPGEVLVAPATTPAWTPLFARAAAVVADTGGVGSHSSIVAREYGIPCVVGTGDATARLRDGQVVTVDGNAGVVRISA
jgi:phosphohistidine swiveling domain-containing protein